MAKGWFVDGEGVPVYFGMRRDKAELEGRCAFVALEEAGERPSDLHGWDGKGWAPSGRLAAAAERRRVLADLARLDEAAPRAVEDLVDALVARGVLTLADLPEAAGARLAAKRALREALPAPAHRPPRRP